MFFSHERELCIFSGHWRWAAGECSLKTSLGYDVPGASTLCRVECGEQSWILPKIHSLMPCLQKRVAHILEQIASTHSPWQRRPLSAPVNSHADLSHPAKEQTCMPISGYQQDFSMGGGRDGFLSPKAASDPWATIGAGSDQYRKGIDRREFPKPLTRPLPSERTVRE